MMNRLQPLDDNRWEWARARRVDLASAFCGNTPTPTLPRKRERESASVVATNSSAIVSLTSPLLRGS